MTTWVKMTKAAEEFGISATRLAVIVEKRKIQTASNPLDGRERLVDIEQLRAALRPEPIVGDTKKK